MRNTFIYQYRWNGLLFFCGILATLLAPQAAKSADAGTAGKVAVVNGTDIFLKDIQVSLDDIKRTLLTRNGGRPINRDKSALLEIQKNVETHNLFVKIDSIITDQQMKRFQITVSDKDLHEMWQKYDPAFIRLSVGIKVNLSLLSMALNEVYEKGKDPNKVYKEILSSTQTSKKSWEASLYYYKSAKKREELKARLKKENLIMSEHGPYFKDMVIQIELDKEINKSLQKTDLEFAYYKKLLPHYYVGWDIPEKGLSGEKGDAWIYIDYARGKWWHDLYERSDITIFDKRYKNALVTLLAYPSKLLKHQVEQSKPDYYMQFH